ncbi:MAG: HAMP domain-containing sensor histidine kinase [Eubacteriales bacterium]|nr:HAMP domain-containing sensor histidine kinase [Eubacteriales bacterium]
MTKETGKQKLRKIWQKVDQSIGSKRFVSLNVKLTAVVLFAAALAIALYATLSMIEYQIGGKFFSSRPILNQVLDSRYESLEMQIKDQKLRGDDTAALQKWVDSQRNTELVVYNKDGIQFTSGWIVDNSGRVRMDVRSKDGSTDYSNSSNNAPFVYASLSIDVSNFREDHNNQIVRFSDGKYYVYINVHNQQTWYLVMSIVSVFVSVFVFFLVILIYNKSVIRRIIDGSKDVRAISEGDLDHPAARTNNDEIGILSDSVEVLRKSLKEKTEGEKAALDANTELITSMSHDIRTPLTSLIGYIDIIEGGKYQTKEELNRYIHSCKDKAIQLKNLSDKLFNYFLVFGNQKQDTRSFEEVDGSVLFRQLIVEHETELEIQGFRVNNQFDIPEGIMVKVDIQAIMRVFDNLFSNMLKYASIDFPIEIKVDYIQDKIKLVFQNHIRSEAKLVESTKIGVKTCKKIIEDHGAVFHAMEEERIYTTEILFEPANVVPESEADTWNPSESSAAAESSPDADEK